MSAPPAKKPNRRQTGSPSGGRFGRTQYTDQSSRSRPLRRGLARTGRPDARQPVVNRARASLPGRKQQTKGGSGWASLPGRKPQTKTSSGLAGRVAGLFSSKRPGQKSAGKQGPAKKGMAGVIAAAGLGATALMRRQRARKAAVESPAENPDAAVPQRPDGPRPEASVDP